ncbi:MAG TPA: hypothetical protein VG838_15620 [Opitutaceae bacterium]|nr:hypothetical protein [Opitutaceae bacterium]
MSRWRIASLLLGLASLARAETAPMPAPAAAAATDQATVVVVVGAAGEEEFGTVFKEEASHWEKACTQAGARRIEIGQAAAGKISDFDQLKQVLEAEPKEGTGDLWVVLIGHGTFDGHDAKFNLRGPDLSATDLALWLQPFHRPLAIIDTSSASAPFLAKLAGVNRVVITATRSGFEQNYTRFGRYFAEAIGDPQGDIDKDGETSLLEAFLSASARLAEFYKTEGRLATEHPLIEDNGDGLGTPPDWFRGVRAVKKASNGATVDGIRAQQFVLVPSAAEQKLSPATRAERDRLELALAKLRDSKARLPEDEYYRRLEALLLELAKLYEPPAS